VIAINRVSFTDVVLVNICNAIVLSSCSSPEFISVDYCPKKAGVAAV
jgi:hypothetical protein